MAQLIPMSELKSAKGIEYSRPHLYRLIKASKFPRPIRLSENRVAFVETELDDWIAGKIAERDAAAA